jgi:hypothetical protein
MPTDIWEMLEQAAPEGCADVQDLYSWSLNFDAGKGPFALFLDLIGWTEDNGFGRALYDLDHPNLGYVELSKLATALTAYSDYPHDVTAYVDQLMAAESDA